MNLLLTGCAGFIGFNFLKEFKSVRNEFQKVISIDKMGYASKHIEKNYFELCDELKIETVATNINSINFRLPGKWVVLNFASESHVDNSINDPLVFFMENVSIIPSLIKCVGIDNIVKFIQISTDEIYGDIPLDTPSMFWFEYDRPSPYKPNNPYSASKGAQDLFLRSLNHTFGLNIQTIRLANQFGPWQHKEKFISKSILRALENKPIELHGDGSNIRQWTPVVDSVKVIKDVLINKINDPLVHIAHQHKLINNENVVKIWGEILKKNYGIGIECVFIENRRGNDIMYALKTSPTINSYFTEDLYTRFEETIDWYVNNKEKFLEDL